MGLAVISYVIDVTCLCHHFLYCRGWYHMMVFGTSDVSASLGVSVDFYVCTVLTPSSVFKLTGRFYIWSASIVCYVFVMWPSLRRFRPHGMIRFIIGIRRFEGNLPPSSKIQGAWKMNLETLKVKATLLRQVPFTQWSASHSTSPESSFTRPWKRQNSMFLAFTNSHKSSWICESLRTRKQISKFSLVKLCSVSLDVASCGVWPV